MYTRGSLDSGGSMGPTNVDGGSNVDGGDADTIVDAGDGGQVRCSPNSVVPDGGICNGNCQAIHLFGATPTGIGIYGGLAYISDQGGSINECSLSDCASSFIEIVAPNSASTEAFAVSAGGSGIYWTLYERSIWAASLTGGAARAIDTIDIDAGNVSPDETALAGTNLYWSLLPDGIMTCDVGDCAATQKFAVAPGGSADLVNGLATDGVSLFWTSMDYGWIREADLDGNNVRTLADQLTLAPGALAVDSCRLYWVVFAPVATNTLAVMTCDRSACAQTVQLFATVRRDEFFALALDDTNVYLLVRDSSTLYVLPKP